MEFSEQNVPPEIRAKLRRLMEARGWTFEEAVNEALLEAVASGGTAFAGRRKAPVLKLVGLKRPSTG